MARKMSKALREALESDCAHSLEPVLKNREKGDFLALQQYLSLHPSVKTKQYRAKAIYLLGRWGDPAPVNALRRILPRLDESERITAIDALGRLGTDEALTGVLAYANDSSPNIRKFVVHALARINSPTARTTLEKMSSKDSVDRVRATASKHLRR